ncbi:MAG: hypothetical protein DMG50_23490 [Acidobacteria bacterium]|nr:MAG: hypothetical protein DMG50_23490 [Acidobacteriota bacterium]
MKTNQETIPGFAIVDTPIRASARITPSANAGRRVPRRSRKIQGILRQAKIQTTLDLYAREDGDETRAAQGEYLTALGVGWQLVQ